MSEDVDHPIALEIFRISEETLLGMFYREVLVSFGSVSPERALGAGNGNRLGSRPVAAS